MTKRAMDRGLRGAVGAPLDVYVEVPDGFGGYVRTYEVPEGFDPFTAVAIGRRGSPEVLHDDLQVKEARTRTRRPSRSSAP